ncbi:lytic transglycosylase domain-containing protein [Thalassococcus lentus]|uniref:Lytic transglycosylase domain-containing protein n=1 Tax=Thalassococcus lentus TaxID=1210524 RepID=A0ABT4XV60_9RHOB|nr:lytic transglycosylase domain-containing protein [Thalassococcus lentus]MDA7425856.1 lytic transglycosylase domain-containing protein [Thalassococcus lentus]
MVLRMFFGLILLLPGLAMAEPGKLCSRGSFGQVQCIRDTHFVYDTCQAIEQFALAHELDPGFFARLIWQESRFDPNAVSHANAQGIAQFIPSTARLRGLLDPFNPADALEHSAEYLGEMSRRYGNHGLAAVGYNGGERRAEGLIAGTGGLARETVNYVQIITGLTAETWRDTPPERHDFRLQPDKPFAQACHELAKNRKLSKFPTPKPAFAPWGVQVAFGTTKSNALKQYKSRMRRCAGLVKGIEPELIWQKSRASPRGGYFMARIGRKSRNEGWKLCSRLKRQGCVCAVYRNE